MSKPKTEVYYEWVIEYLEEDLRFNEDPDIEDVSSNETLSEALREISDCDKNMVRIALRRDSGNEDEGVVDRGYAYLKDGLPDYFYCGHKVPQKYHNEAARHKSER